MIASTNGMNEIAMLYVVRLCEYLTEAEHVELAILFLDLDNFKPYNDTFGHDAGDIVLVGMVNIFKEVTDKKGFVCRYGGDEFIMILNTDDREILEQIAKGIYEKNNYTYSSIFSDTCRAIGLSHRHYSDALDSQSGGQCHCIGNERFLSAQRRQYGQQQMYTRFFRLHQRHLHNQHFSIGQPASSQRVRRRWQRFADLRQSALRRHQLLQPH